VPKHELAAVEGWRVAALRGEVYPALVPATGLSRGLLLTDLTPDEWRLLDAFEAPRYELKHLILVNNIRCWAYVRCQGTDVSPENWNIQEFKTYQLNDYVRRCRKWREQHLDGIAAD
jgi:hypothetical protein